MKWEIHSEQDKRIYEIIKDIAENDDMEALDVWENYLNDKLKFPFQAEVYESDFGSPIQAGDKLRVHSIGMVDDLYGIIVDVRKGRKKYATPLCELEVFGENDEMKQLVDDYSVWFCNR